MWGILWLVSILTACSESDYQIVDKGKSYDYVYHPLTKKVFYTHYRNEKIEGYSELPNTKLKDFNVLSQFYATSDVSVFYQGKLIENAIPESFMPHPEFPNNFAKDTMRKTYYYQDTPLDLDFDTAKIHSLNYISDQYKILFNNRYSKSNAFAKKVPVEDIASFEVINNNEDLTIGIYAKDKYWLYESFTRLPIMSQDVEFINDDSLPPDIIFSQGKLYYITKSRLKHDIDDYKPVNLFRNIPSHLTIENTGIIAEEGDDVYYQLLVKGFQNLEYIEGSRWLVDDNGLYHLLHGSIFQLSNERHASYHFDPEYPNHIWSNKALFTHYDGRSTILSASATVIPETYGYLIIDNGQLFHYGKLIPEVHTDSFMRIRSGYYGYIDKNYYYDKDFRKKAISPQEYEQLKNKTLQPEDLSGIDAYGNVIP